MKKEKIRKKAEAKAEAEEKRRRERESQVAAQADHTLAFFQPVCGQEVRVIKK